jgi:hypothetical protein
VVGRGAGVNSGVNSGIALRPVAAITSAAVRVRSFGLGFTPLRDSL